MTTQRDGQGPTITFGTSAFTASLISVDGPAVERAAIDTSHLGLTSAKTFMPASLYDPGGCDITIAFDPADEPPMTSAAETITIDWAGTADTWAFSGFMTNYRPSATGGERMEAQITIKATGPITGLIAV